MKRFITIGLIGVALIIIALGLNFWLTAEEPDSGEEVSPSVTSPPPEQEQPSVRPEGGPSSPPAPSESPDDAAAPVTPPEFDVVRISGEGNMVVVGRATPGTTVTVLENGQPLGSVTADKRGEWVLLPGQILPPGERELSLRSETADGQIVESPNVVILVVPQRKEPPLAVLTPRSGKGGSRVLQGLEGRKALVARAGGLSLNSIDYDPAGIVNLGGEGIAKAEVRVYLDNELAGQVTIRDIGFWQMQLDRPVPAGHYTVRLDQLVDGRVTGRLEVPFERLESTDDMAAGGFVVVRPGNSLWRISRRILGRGIHYTTIVKMNASHIRNPNLIYPGQAFVVPAPTDGTD